MRVAIVHDWLYVLGGAERVLTEILDCYPNADVFTLFDFLSASDREQIGLKSVTTSFLQRLPLVKSHHRSFLPLMPLAIEQFDLSGYDVVISSSYAIARGVITGPDQTHVCYVHSPMRYAWDLQNAYLSQSGKDKGFSGAFARLLLHYMRIWDVRTAQGPDAMASNSQFVARRIRKIYGRESTVINPPVKISATAYIGPRSDYFFAASRLVPYKNMDLIVRAFSDMPDLKLVVAGDGPESRKLKQMARSNIEFRGWVSDAEMRRLMAGARAFVFAAEEDFGIAPVEAQAEGTPVLAYGRGGVLETIKVDGPDKTGQFFHDLSEDAVMDCVRSFIRAELNFTRAACRKQAEAFSSQVFREKFVSFVEAHSGSYRARATWALEAKARARLEPSAIPAQ